MPMPFAAQNQGKRFKNKVVFQSRPYAYESMSSYYSGVEKVCPWNPDFPVIHWHVFCKPLKLHNGRRAENCCRSYKRSRLSHEPLIPWALVLQVGTMGLQAGGQHQWPGWEVQVYHWGQDADVFIPLTSAAGLWLTSHFFFAQNAAHCLKQQYLRGDSIDWYSGSCGCFTQNAEESGDILTWL